MMQFRGKRTTGAVAALMGCVLMLATAGVGKPGSPARQNKPPSSANKGKTLRIGAVNIAYGTLEMVSKVGKNPSLVIDAKGGPNGAPNANFLSERYDLSAPRIQATIIKGAVMSATATGGAHLIVRDLEQHRVINLTSPTGTYFGPEKTATGEVTRPARIEMRGGVKGIMTAPEISESDPIVINTASVDVVFVDAETTSLKMVEGTGKGTILEPPAKKKP